MKQRDKQSIVADALADIAVVCGFVAWAALAGTVWWKLESVDVKPERSNQ